MPRSKLKQHSLLPLFIVLALAACSGGTTPARVPSLTPSPAESLTPTATPIPLAVSVNGQGLTQPEFEAEVARYQQAQAALGNTVSRETARQVVGDDVINTLLLEQGAAASGFVVDEALLQARLETLAGQMGGMEALLAWESAHGYSEQDFRASLRRQVAAAWMRDQLAGSVAPIAEQVHARQILFYNTGDAQQALESLQAGVPFDDLAAQADPLTKGELGWFPRGYLPSRTIEDAAFALQAGQYSGILQDGSVYHILYVVERDPARPLTPDALITLQEGAIQAWLAQQKETSILLLAP